MSVCINRPNCIINGSTLCLFIAFFPFVISKRATHMWLQYKRNPLYAIVHRPLTNKWIVLWSSSNLISSRNPIFNCHSCLRTDRMNMNLFTDTLRWTMWEIFLRTENKDNHFFIVAISSLLPRCEWGWLFLYMYLYISFSDAVFWNISS